MGAGHPSEAALQRIRKPFAGPVEGSVALRFGWGTAVGGPPFEAGHECFLEGMGMDGQDTFLVPPGRPRSVVCRGHVVLNEGASPGVLGHAEERCVDEPETVFIVDDHAGVVVGHAEGVVHDEGRFPRLGAVGFTGAADSDVRAFIPITGGIRRRQFRAVFVPHCPQIAVRALDDAGGVHVPMARHLGVEDERGFIEGLFRRGGRNSRQHKRQYGYHCRSFRWFLPCGLR